MKDKRVWKRVVSTAVMLLAALLLLAVGPFVVEANAATYTATESTITITVQDHAGNPIKGEGWLEVYGPYYAAGVLNEKYTDENGDTYFNHIDVGTVAWDFTQYSAVASVGAARDTRGGNRFFKYTYKFTGFDDKYSTPYPEEDTFYSWEVDSLTFTVDRYDVELAVSLENKAGNPVQSGVTVTMNGQSDSDAPYIFTGLREGTTYDIQVTGSGYDCSGTYTVERDGKQSRTFELNIGEATFDFYSEVKLGEQPFSGASVKVGEVTLQETETKGLYYGKVPVGHSEVTVSGSGITTHNTSATVTSAGYPRSNPCRISVTSYPIKIYGVPDGNQLAFGQAVQLYAAADWNDQDRISGATYTWSSSNPDVAAVDSSGKVTGTGLGTATISVKVAYGTDVRTASADLTVEKASIAMPAGALSDKDIDLTKDTITLPADIRGAHKLTVTAACAGPVPVNQTMTIDHPVAGGAYEMDFGKKLQGPVTYTFVYESNYCNFATASASITKNYYYGLGEARLDQKEFPYTGFDVKPEVRGLEAGTYSLDYCSVYISKWGEGSIYWPLSGGSLSKLTTDNDVDAVIIGGPSAIREDCPCAVYVKGREDLYYKGSQVLVYTIVPRPLTITAADQEIPYATSAIVETAATTGAGQLLGGHTVTAQVQIDENDRSVLTVVPNSVKILAGTADAAKYYKTTYAAGKVTYTKNLNTKVEINKNETRVDYTYGESVELPKIAVSGAYASDVQYRWYPVGQEHRVQPWSDSNRPVNAGSYVIEAFTEDNEKTAAASDQIQITIAKRTITALNAVTEKVYDGGGAIAVPAVTFDGLQYGENLIAGVDYTLGDAVLTAQNGKFDVGTGYVLTGTIRLMRTGRASNYLVADAYTGTTAITPRSITEADVDDLASAVYTGQAIMPDIAAVYNGMTLVKDRDYQLSYADNLFVGSATVTVAGIGNYDGTTQVTFRITQATPQITVLPQTGAITYGQTLADSPLSGGTALGVLGDVVTGNFEWFDASAMPAAADSGTTPYKVVFHPTDTRNYTTAEAEVTLTVNRKAVTVTADAKTKIFGEADPALTYTTTALVGNDKLFGALSRAAGEQTGTYAITQGSVTNEHNPNYTITYVGAELTIEPKVVTAPTVELPDSVAYNAAAQEPAIVVKDGETVIPAEEYRVSYADNTDVGTATVTITDVAGGNYTVSGTAQFAITPRAVTIRAKNQVLHVGFPAPKEPVRDVHYTVDGLLEGDSLGTVTMQYRQNGAAVTPNPLQIGRYEIVILVENPNPNYTITYENGTLTYFYAVYPSVSFTDVPEHAWYYDAVEYVCSEGLMDGVGGGRFDPDGSASRAMIVTILWRMEGSPMDSDSSSFRDVERGSWYSYAVDWASAFGIVEGYSEAAFGPHDAITREQLATILWRYAAYRGEDVSAEGSLAFRDAAAVSAYAVKPMQWAVHNGLIQGVNEMLCSGATATRAQLAAILMRFLIR